jgi:hypothetical protein
MLVVVAILLAVPVPHAPGLTRHEVNEDGPLGSPLQPTEESKWTPAEKLSRSIAFHSGEQLPCPSGDAQGQQWSEDHERQRLKDVIARNYSAGSGYDPYLSDVLIELFGSQGLGLNSLLSVGCGVCLYEEDLAKRGVSKVVGIEPNLPEDIWPSHIEVRRDIDVIQNTSLEPKLGVFDVVANIEVAEHIPREAHPQWFDWLVEHTGKYMIFSAAHVGQGGCGHISESPEEYWRGMIETRGLSQNLPMTDRIRQVVTDRNFKVNMMVFERSKRSEHHGWTLDPRVVETPGQFTGCPDGQRNAAESECAAAVHEAALALGLSVGNRLRRMDAGAEGVIPAGCSYSRASQMAMFNPNPAGRTSSVYELVCIEEGPPQQQK